MKDFMVVYERENGTTGSDFFTAGNSLEARSEFMKCYRHLKDKIISIHSTKELEDLIVKANCNNDLLHYTFGAVVTYFKEHDFELERVIEAVKTIYRY